MPRTNLTERRRVSDNPVTLAVLVTVPLLTGVLYLASAMPSLDQFDGRGSFLWEVAKDSLLDPAGVVAYWIGPAGASLLDRFLVLSLVVGVVAVARAAGWIVLRAFLGESSLTQSESVVLATGLGLGLVSLGVRVVGFVKLDDVVFRSVFAVTGIGVLGGFVWILRRGFVNPSQKEDASSLSLCWLWLIAPITLFTVLGGMLPPIDFDVLEYHLQAPKEFYLAQQIEFLPHNVYANMPLGAEMFALLGMRLVGDWWWGGIIGKTIMAIFAPLTAIAAFTLARQMHGTAAGVVAAILFMTTPWVVKLANLGLNEIVLAFFILATVQTLVTGRLQASPGQPMSWRWLILSGLICGLAIGVKYTAVPYVFVPMLIWIIVGTARVASVQHAISRGTFFAAAALATCWPWFVANAINTGNPVYPLLANVMETATRTEVMTAQWNAAHAPPDFELRDAVSRSTDFASRSEWQNPLIVPLAIVAACMLQCRFLRTLAAYVIYVFACWWLITHRLDRFWVPVLPVACVVAGCAVNVHAARVWRNTLIASLVAWTCVATLLAVHPASFCGYARFFADYAWLRTDPVRVQPWRQQINEIVDADGAILAVGDAAVFDMKPRTYYNTVFDAWLLREWMGSDDASRRQSAALRDALQSRGIGYVYVHWGELARYRNTYDRDFRRSEFITPALFDRLVQDGVLVLLEANVAGAPVSLYHVAAAR